ncbi:hypothetical protein PF628_gp20 [Klebsiella phage VLCpiS11a]|uniref:hypothetical protein n=1 Tax=Klebsiella phage VLCpiS11a TaxID=2874884 RepID=UPI0022DCDEF8|nr:hypothetical protein PF628_gp20 [Klebsiella phage VLCpiS11a]UVX30676.1 hypothetical protein S11a_00020 [Klebsiella phage VLCpiS11a]
MIYRMLKALAYVLSMVISWAMIAPCLVIAMPFIMLAFTYAGTMDADEIMGQDTRAGRLMRWVNGWDWPNIWISWVERFTGIYH